MINRLEEIAGLLATEDAAVRGAYRPRSFDAKGLSDSETLILERLLRGLAARKATLPDGRLVTGYGDSLRWVLAKIAEPERARA